MFHHITIGVWGKCSRLIPMTTSIPYVAIMVDWGKSHLREKVVAHFTCRTMIGSWSKPCEKPKPRYNSIAFIFKKFKTTWSWYIICEIILDIVNCFCLSKVLLGMLRNYYEHVKMYPNTLLTKFLGLYEIKFVTGRKVHPYKTIYIDIYIYHIVTNLLSKRSQKCCIGICKHQALVIHIYKWNEKLQLCALIFKCVLIHCIWSWKFALTLTFQNSCAKLFIYFHPSIML